MTRFKIIDFFLRFYYLIVDDWQVRIGWEKKLPTKRSPHCLRLCSYRASKCSPKVYWCHLCRSFWTLYGRIPRPPHLWYCHRRLPEGGFYSQYSSDTVQSKSWLLLYFWSYLDGYITNLSSMTNAVCVRTCPTSANIPSQCLSDGLSTSPCVAGLFTPSYPSFAVDSYCVPNNATNINIESLFSGDAYEAWVYDMDTAWIVLLCSAGAAIILSLMFFIFVRMCASFIIWLSVVIAIGGMITVGVFFILTAKGVVVDDYVYDHLDGLSYNTLIIVGSAILVAAFLLFLLVLCLHSRLSMGTKAV